MLNYHTMMHDKNPIFCKSFSSDIMDLLNGDNISENTKETLRKALMMQEIKDVIDEARKLQYCNIWTDNNEGELSYHKLDDDELIFITLEAEAG